MDKAAEELNRSSIVFIGAETRLNIIKNELQEIERQIALMSNLEAHLNENIRILKRRRIITKLEDFKKAREDQKTAGNRRNSLSLDLIKTTRIKEQCEIVYKQAKDTYELALKNVQEPISNVFMFRRKDG